MASTIMNGRGNHLNDYTALLKILMIARKNIKARKITTQIVISG